MVLSNNIQAVPTSNGTRITFKWCLLRMVFERYSSHRSYWAGCICRQADTQGPCLANNSRANIVKIIPQNAIKVLNAKFGLPEQNSVFEYNVCILCSRLFCLWVVCYSVAYYPDVCYSNVFHSVTCYSDTFHSNACYPLLFERFPFEPPCFLSRRRPGAFLSPNESRAYIQLDTLH